MLWTDLAEIFPVETLLECTRTKWLNFSRPHPWRRESLFCTLMYDHSVWHRTTKFGRREKRERKFLWGWRHQGSPSMSMGSNILAEMCAPMTVIVEAVSQTIWLGVLYCHSVLKLCWLCCMCGCVSQLAEVHDGQKEDYDITHWRGTQQTGQYSAAMNWLYEGSDVPYNRNWSWNWIRLPLHESVFTC